MIQAKILTHSKSQIAGELITFELTFPTIILAEVNTHRMASKNTSSLRAIPFEKVVQTVKNNPFIPIEFQKHHKGMQGGEYVDEFTKPLVEKQWLQARDSAIEQAQLLYNSGISKQLCNRLLSPFCWTTMMFTTSKAGLLNLFELRCPKYTFEGEVFEQLGYQSNTNKSTVYFSKKQAVKQYGEVRDENNEFWRGINKGQAEVHFMDLAEKMYDCYNESVPEILQPDQWHIPHKDKMMTLEQFAEYCTINKIDNNGSIYDRFIEYQLKMSVALTARTSYTTIDDENELSIEKAQQIYDKCTSNGHWSTCEHIGQVLNQWAFNNNTKNCTLKGYVDNFEGFRSLRNILQSSTNNKMLRLVRQYNLR